MSIEMRVDSGGSLAVEDSKSMGIMGNQLSNISL